MTKPMTTTERQELNERLLRACETQNAELVLEFLHPRFTKDDPMGLEYYLEFKGETLKQLLDAAHAVQVEAFTFGAARNLHDAMSDTCEVLAHFFGGQATDYCVDSDP